MTTNTTVISSTIVYKHRWQVKKYHQEQGHKKAYSCKSPKRQDQKNGIQPAVVPGCW